MWLADIFDMLFPPPPLGPHPDELKRERAKNFEKPYWRWREKINKAEELEDLERGQR